MDALIKAARKSSQESGTGSEFLVLSNLYRLGINAFISFGNTKQIDIIIQARNGMALTVDVKSVRDYSSIPVTNVRAKENHFLVVVVYNRRFADLKSLPDFYIIPSIKIDEIQEIYKAEKRLLKGKLSNFKDQWHFLAC
ncbi:hypothetical protein SAMN05216327_11891 [Dyadobacter sp. SG02]|uniref:hypothetical protein n=1 Tax=Dyadobacter sp. SG02 TaxID=1855291 RepID=UPI0008ACC289|nr:hypothetical protein [Dyadobacter sp. SG02]SEJ75190.1 hypothetical protein SAMN05216327_11891 [Dyadobacter sp. SG02]